MDTGTRCGGNTFCQTDKWIWGLVSAVWPGCCHKGMGTVLFLGLHGELLNQGCYRQKLFWHAWSCLFLSWENAGHAAAEMFVPSQEQVTEGGDTGVLSWWQSWPGTVTVTTGLVSSWPRHEPGLCNNGFSQLQHLHSFFIANNLGEVLWNSGSFCLITWQSLPKLFRQDLYMWPCRGTQ